MQAYAKLQNRLKEGYDNQQGSISHAGNVIIPGTPNTKRNHLSHDQKVQRYLDSVKGNPDVDASKMAAREAAKIPRLVQKVTQKFDFFGPINSGVATFTKVVERGVTDVGAMLLKRDVSEESGSPDYSLEWRSPAGCEQSTNYTLKSSDMICTWVNRQNQKSSNPVKASVEIIGDMKEDFVPYAVPTMFDERMIRLFVESLRLKQTIWVERNDEFHEMIDISILATENNCAEIERILSPAELQWNCDRLREGQDPVQQIDDFIRDRYQNFQSLTTDCGLLLSPLLIEEWARKSKLLRENGLAAIAVRARDWKAFNYGLIAGGAAAGMLCVTGIVVTCCRDRISKTASAAGSAIKQFATKSGCIARDDEEVDGEDHADAVIEMTGAETVATQVRGAGLDVEESSVVVSSPDPTASSSSSDNQ